MLRILFTADLMNLFNMLLDNLIEIKSSKNYNYIVYVVYEIQ